MAMNNSSSQQAGGRGEIRIPRTSMQAVDMERQAAIGPTNKSPPPSYPHFRQQAKSPRTQQQQVLQRSMSSSPTQQFADVRRMSTTLQGGMVPQMQEGRRPSPTKRASFDPQLEQEASQEERYPSPTKRKTIIVNPTSFDITSRPQAVPPQQEVAFPRKSMMHQQGQPLSARKSMMTVSSSQPVSPRKSMVPQQLLHSSTLSPRKSMYQQPVSPRKSMLPQPGAGLPTRSVSMYREHSTPSLEQENPPASSSYVTHRSMSLSPAARMQDDNEDDYEDDDDDDDDDYGGGGGYNSQNMSVSRSTSMSPPPTVRFQDNQSVLMPTSSHNQMVNRSATMARPSQVNQPAPGAANTNPRMSISPRLMQLQQQSQQSPARLQSSINRSKSISPSQMNLEQQQQSAISRSMSISPTQMNMEQQRQPRLSSTNLGSAQGIRPGSPPQLNRYFSTAGPRASVVTPNRTSNTFQPPQLLPVSSSKRMQMGRASIEHGASSSSTSRGPLNTEWHMSVTDVVLRSMAAIASAVAFCVMITNTVWINNQTISYSSVAGFRRLRPYLCTRLGLTLWRSWRS